MNALSCYVLIHTHLSARHHVLYRTSELVYFQGQQDLSLQLLQDTHYFSVVFGCLRHYLLPVLRRVQVEYVPVLAVEVGLAFAGQHLPQHARVGRSQLSPCLLEELGVIEDEPKPKLVVISQ